MASAAATALWAAVVLDYDSDGLLSLTNPRNPAASSIDTTTGESAAESVVNLWPVYAQAVYDSADAQHVEVAKLAVIAVLWRRGGTSTNIERIKWDEVFGANGAVESLRNTAARARPGPSSNSGVRQEAETTADGREVLGWSDPDALPGGRKYLPSRRTT